MKILLANPPCRIPLENGKERYFVRAGSRWPFSIVKRREEKLCYTPFPFYLAYAAALLEQDEFDVSVIDGITLNQTEEGFLRNAIAEKPDLVVFETSTPTIHQDLALAEMMKQATSCIIVLCGAHVTEFPREVLEKTNSVDFIIRREYELTLRELVRRLSLKRAVSDLPGIAYKQNQSITITSESRILDELDQLPFPARHLFPSKSVNDLNLYWDGFCQLRPAIQMHASRGCPFRCNFCMWIQVMYNNGKQHVFSPKRIVDEMEHVVEKYGAREIYFDDDDFTVNKNHVLELCKEIRRRSFTVHWSVMGDAMVTTEEMIDAMADAGCIGMKFGVESGDSEVLRKMNKPIKFDKVERIADRCAKRGIKTHATFSFGVIGETRESMRRTLDFAKRLNVDSVQFSINTPFPGTKYYEEMKERGLLLSEDWVKFDGACSSVIRFENLTREEVEEYYIKARGRWLRAKIVDPRWVWRQLKYVNRIRKGQGWAGVWNRIYGGISLVVTSE